MRKYVLTGYGLATLAAVVALGFWCLVLLGQARELRSLRQRQQQQAQTDALAAAVTRALADTQQALWRDLVKMDPATLATALTALQTENPLVHGVFAVNPASGEMLVPNPSSSQSASERELRRRGDALFSGRCVWMEVSQCSVEAGSEKGPGWMRGWLPWRHENQLTLLAWVRHGDTGPVYGVEVDATGLVSRLIPALAGTDTAGGWALLDGAGRVLHQSAATAPELPARSLASSTAIGPGLPGWSVTAWAAPSGAGAGTMLFAAVALVLLIVVGAVASSLLWRAARRSCSEAAQRAAEVASVSQELKIPVTAIGLCSELLSEDRLKDRAKQRQHARVIARESQRLTRVVNNVLAGNLFVEQAPTYRVKPLDLVQTINDVISAQRARLAEAGLKLELDIPEQHVMLNWDRDALEQTLLNLLENVERYARSGGELTLVLLQETQGWDLEVLDRGPGIPVGSEARLFEKFFRCTDPVTAREPGCGLGLYVARRMMRDLGGDLRYEPREGGGAAFHMLFFPPRAKPGDAVRGGKRGSAHQRR